MCFFVFFCSREQLHISVVISCFLRYMMIHRIIYMHIYFSVYLFIFVSGIKLFEVGLHLFKALLAQQDSLMKGYHSS